MTAVERALAELEEYGAGDDWATHVVEAAGFTHIAMSPACVGWCIIGSGRALCGLCEWQLSGRLDDVGEQRSARFALFALAMIGAAIAAAGENATTRIEVEAATEGEAMQKAIAKLREQYPDAEISSIEMRRILEDEDLS